MAAKVDQKVFERIKYLLNQGLTHAVIATRLGISPRTVRVYVRAIKTGLKPYEKPDVPSDSHTETAG